MFPMIPLLPSTAQREGLAVLSRSHSGQDSSLPSEDRIPSGSFAQILSLLMGTSQNGEPIREAEGTLSEESQLDRPVMEDLIHDVQALAMLLGLEKGEASPREILLELIQRLNSLSEIETSWIERELLQEGRALKGLPMETIISQLEELVAIIETMSSPSINNVPLLIRNHHPVEAELFTLGQVQLSDPGLVPSKMVQNESNQGAGELPVGAKDSHLGRQPSSLRVRNGNIDAGFDETKPSAMSADSIGQNGRAENFTASLPVVKSVGFPTGQGEGGNGQATNLLDGSQLLRSNLIPSSLPSETRESSQLSVARYNFLVQDLQQIIRMKVLSGVGDYSQLKVKIIPAHLGEIDILLTSQDGKITIQLMASSRLAMETLDRHLYQLQAVLYQQGVQVDRIEVTQQPQTNQMITAGEGEGREGAQHFQEERGASRRQAAQESEQFPFSAETEDEEGSVVNYTV